MSGYSELVTALGALLVIPITDPTSATPSSNTDFNNFLPVMLSGGEQRIYREIDFLATREEDVTTILTAGDRNATLPADIIVMQSAGYVTPAGADPDDALAETHMLEIVSKDFIDHVWPIRATTTDEPQYIAQLNATDVIIGGTPDDDYKLVVTGIFRPAALSSTNTNTYITDIYPDLMLYSCMVIGAGYQRDYGAQSDDPKMATSWESMYQIAKKSTLEEDQRRKTQSTNWSPFSSAPLSNPQRK